jgi:succinyl-CoA synthetase alpha subunit
LVLFLNLEHDLQAADQVVKQGLGITTAIGWWRSNIGTTTKEAVELLNDPETKCIVMIGDWWSIKADAALD